MTLTLDQLKACMPTCPDPRVRLMHPHLVAAMSEWGIATPLDMAAFLAQLGHESLDLRYVEEIASGAAYEGRVDLGNTKPEAISAAAARNTTPGRFYKGHGPIQVTGYNNHLEAGVALCIDAVNHPELLATPEHGFRSAGHFWKKRGLSKLAAMGMRPTVLRRRIKGKMVEQTHPAFDVISFKVNGGWNGKADRRARYRRNVPVLLGV